MQVQSENGSVIKSNIPAKNVRTNAQNPGPSGSAEIEKEKKILRFSQVSNCLYYSETLDRGIQHTLSY